MFIFKMLKINPLNLFLILQFFLKLNAYEPFSQIDEGPFLGSFDTLIKDSYSAPLPNDLCFKSFIFIQNRIYELIINL
jgi:hypothetical protein